MKKLVRMLALILTVCLLLTASSLAAFGGPGDPDSGAQGGMDPGAQGGMDPGAQGGTAPDGQGGTAPGGQGGGSSSGVSSWDAVYDITSDTAYESQSLSSSTGDQNVVHVYNGANMIVRDCTVTNSGSGSGGDNASFYGVGASLFVSDGRLYVDGTSISTTGSGNAGVFAYSSGTAYVNDTTITTTDGSAGGLHVAGGGTLYAWDCNVTTAASSASAAIRSDRGGGTMVIDGGTYTTKGGTGAVYVTADITIHDAVLTSGASEAVAMEGRNTLRLFDCDLSGTMTNSNQNSGTVSTWGIILYQSMSGDSEVGTAVYEMDGGSLKINTTGPMFYTTNTSSEFTLRDVDINYSASSYDQLLAVAGNDNSRGWGTSGSNGATCVFTAYDQTLKGVVAYDSISSLDLYLLEGTTLTGSVVKNDSLNGGHSGSKTSNVYIDSTSTWTVTADSTVTGTLYNAGTIENAKIVVNGSTVATFGSGTYTVTAGAYKTTVSTSGAGVMESWSSYAVANPFENGTVPSITPSKPSSANLNGWTWDTEAGGWLYYVKGTPQTGWLWADGTWYYLDPDTGVMVTGWLDDTWYMNASGAMVTGWAQCAADDTHAAGWYCFDSNGYVQTGWMWYGGSWYYLDPAQNGLMLENCWFGSFYLCSGGAMAAGWCWCGADETHAEGWYYFDGSGYMQTGWLWYGSWYYLDPAQNGLMLDSCWYGNFYLCSGGAMASGWCWCGADETHAEGWYYFDGSGYMQTGWLWDGSWYYLDPAQNGLMLSGGVYIVDGLQSSFNGSGAWLGYAE